MKGTMQSIMETKKSLYCAICDASMQHSFVHHKGLIVYDTNFCYTMVANYGAYIQWLQIEVVRYLDLVNQVVLCHQTPGNASSIPFQGFL